MQTNDALMRRIQVEPRVLVGIAAMVLATGLGAVTLQHATERVSVWQVDHALAAGTVIGAEDVHVTEVALDGVQVYASAAETVIGKTLVRDMAAMELLPATALAARSRPADEVALPVEPQHLPPDLRRGERVDVWLSVTDQQGLSGLARRVLAGARVSDVTVSEVSGRPSVVLAVSHNQVQALVTALRVGELDLVAVGRAN